MSASVKMTSEVGSHPHASTESKSPQSYASACPTPCCWIMYSFASGKKKCEILHCILMSCGRSHNWDWSRVAGTVSCCFLPSVRIKFRSLHLSCAPRTRRAGHPAIQAHISPPKKGNENRLQAPRSVFFFRIHRSGRRFLFGSIIISVYQ